MKGVLSRTAGVPGRVVERFVRSFAAARYAHPVLAWAGVSVAALAVLAGLVWLVVPSPAGPQSSYVPATPAPTLVAAPLPVAKDPSRAAAQCKEFAAELSEIARKYPVYSKLPVDVAARTDQLLSTVGERCAPKIAKRSATDLNGWLTGVHTDSPRPVAGSPTGSAPSPIAPNEDVIGPTP